MLYTVKDLPKLIGKSIFLKTLDNKFYSGILKDTTGTIIELGLPKRGSEYIYKSALLQVSDSRNDIKCPDGNHWIE